MFAFLFLAKICQANDFNFEIKDDILTITCNGFMPNYSSSPWYQANFKKVIFEGNVLSIGNYAFCNCSEFTSIIIPSSVTIIGNYAFYDCDGLISITIPSSVTTIGDSVLSGCSALTKIIVEQGNFNYASVDGVLFNYSKNELINFPAKKVIHHILFHLVL